MAPKYRSPRRKPKPTAWQRFATDLEKARDERGLNAAPGSAFDVAGANSNARPKVELLVREVKVKTVGRSIFSTLALGLEVKEGEEAGISLEIVEEWVDDEAMRTVERQRRERKVKEALEGVDVVMESVEDEDGVARKGKGDAKGRKGKNRKKVVVDLDGDGEMAEADGQGADEVPVGSDGGDEGQDDEVDRIAVPDRTSMRKAKKSPA